MEKAFEEFERIESIESLPKKQREWLKQYESLIYTKGAIEGKQKLGSSWLENYNDKKFDTDINQVGERKDRLKIEFDGDEKKAKEDLEKTSKKLKKLDIGFIRSTHKGKCDYLWIEFINSISEKKKELFLKWIAPEGSEVDTNFKSHKKVFAVLYATHYKHSNNREMPIEYFEGNKIDYDSLEIPREIKGKDKTKQLQNGFQYETFEKEVKKKFEQKEMKQIYNKIIKALKKYMDLKEDDYSLIALWIIGTYAHKNFPAYPYLFFNAMKGSGKTRVLKMIATLSYNGKLTGSMTESVMFRKASERTLCLDEFENVGTKEKTDLRLLLNSAYKKGIVIERASKKRSDKGESYEIEEFEVYCPIAIANIWGMENVLSDRCITIIIEKSSKTRITKLIEDFENNEDFINIKKTLNEIEFEDFQNIYKEWNEYQHVTNGSNDTNGIHGTNVIKQNIENISDINSINSLSLHTKHVINNSDLQGRDLEIFFPLYIISNIVGDNILKQTIKKSQKIVEDRKELDIEENKDVQLIDFVSQYDDTNFIGVTSLTNQFKDYIESNEDWLNSRWLGKALRRVDLVRDKRRLSKTRQVQLNIDKAKEKIKMFKEPDFDEVLK